MPDDLQSHVAQQGAESEAGFGLRLAVALFIISYVVFALILFFDCWTEEFRLLGWLVALPGRQEAGPHIVSVVYTMLGAILGTGVLAMVSFHKYVSDNSFRSSHAWGYFLGPWLAMILGVIAFALVRSGLLVFSAGGSQNTPETTYLGYLAIGFLAGFGWSRFTRAIQRLVERAFSDGYPTDSGDHFRPGDKHATEPTPTSAEHEELANSARSDDEQVPPPQHPPAAESPDD